MEGGSGWSVDVKSLSHDQLAQLIAQLEGSEHVQQRLELQREFIERLRARGLDNGKIIATLVFGVAKGALRDKIAAGWAPAFGLSVREFKRIASGG